MSGGSSAGNDDRASARAPAESAPKITNRSDVIIDGKLASENESSIDSLEDVGRSAVGGQFDSMWRMMTRRVRCAISTAVWTS